MISTIRSILLTSTLACIISFGATAQEEPPTSAYTPDPDETSELASSVKKRQSLDNQTVEISDGKNTRKVKIRLKLGSGGFGEVVIAESISGPKEFIALKIFFNREEDRGISVAETSHVLAYRDLNTAFEGQPFPENVLKYSGPCTIKTEQGIVLIGVYSEVMTESLKNQIPRLAVKLESDSEAVIAGKISKVRSNLEPILKGLTGLHTAGVLYNDLKPANILLKDSILKLADFDASTIIGSVNKSLSKTYYTLEYSAPERIDTGSNPNGRQLPISDAYSVGATIFELIFGEAPLRGMVTNGKTQDTKKIQKEVANFLLRAKNENSEFSKLTNHIRSNFAALRERVFGKETLKEIDFLESFILASSEFDPSVRMNALEKLSESHTFLKSYLAPIRNAFSEALQNVFAKKFNLNHAVCGRANAETLIKSVIF